MIKKKIRILIAEGEADLLGQLQKDLLKYDYEVFTTNDGSLATKELKSNRYDVAILSTKLQGLDIIEEKNYKYETKIIIISSDNNVRTAVEAMKKGALDFITKPFDVAKIHKNITKIPTITKPSVKI